MKRFFRKAVEDGRQLGNALVNGSLEVLTKSGKVYPADIVILALGVRPENALAKARYFNRLTGLPTMADDSGLSVDALGGAPGGASFSDELRLSPEERAEFVKLLQERARARGVALPQQIGSDPKDLGQVVTDLHEKPGQLTDILGGGSGPAQASGSSPLTNVLASPLAKAALAGIAAMVVKRVMRGSAG